MRYRAASVTAGLAALGILAATGGVAVAAPQPTIAQVQKKLTQLSTKIDQLDQQLDQVKQELSSANSGWRWSTSRPLGTPSSTTRCAPRLAGSPRRRTSRATSTRRWPCSPPEIRSRS